MVVVCLQATALAQDRPALAAINVSVQFDAAEPALPFLFNDRDDAGRPLR